MRDQDDAPYVVIERDSGGGLGSFVLGALVGAGLALLFAPKSGAETQEDLKEHAKRFRGAAEERVREAQRQVEERLEEVREGVQTGFNGVKEAVNAGRSAASICASASATRSRSRRCVPSSIRFGANSRAWPTSTGRGCLMCSGGRY